MSCPDIKICGLTRRDDAVLAARAGARFGGVILAPGGKRSIDPAAASQLFRGLALERVGVFVDAGLDSTRRAAEAAELDVLQLHGDESPRDASTLRDEGRWRVWKAVRARCGDDVLEALERFGSAVDGLLLDGWSPLAHGGTGTRFPWEAAAAYRDRIPPHLSLIVAGGLSPANVAEAVAMLRPAVVDVSSGVETSPGVKNAAAVAAFVSAAHRAAHDSLPTT